MKKTARNGRTPAPKNHPWRHPVQGEKSPMFSDSQWKNNKEGRAYSEAVENQRITNNLMRVTV